MPRRADIASTAGANDFLAEARILATLDHPGIVPVYDVGRTAEGRCYIVSKLIEGSDLGARMRAGPCTVGSDGHAGGRHRRSLASRPRPWPGAPRRQAGEHSPRSRGPAVPDRFRARPARGGFRQVRLLRGDPRVHEPRAGPGRRTSRGRPVRRLQPGSGALPVAHRRLAVSSSHAGRDARTDQDRGSPPASSA